MLVVRFWGKRLCHIGQKNRRTINTVITIDSHFLEQNPFSKQRRQREKQYTLSCESLAPKIVFRVQINGHKSFFQLCRPKRLEQERRPAVGTLMEQQTASLELSEQDGTIRYMCCKMAPQLKERGEKEDAEFGWRRRKKSNVKRMTFICPLFLLTLFPIFPQQKKIVHPEQRCIGEGLLTKVGDEASWSILVQLEN